jgi:hypothetical protein
MDTKKKEVVEALSECYGIVTDACRKVGLARSTYYSWLSEDDEFKKAVEETQEEAIDFVEGKLFQKINGVRVRKTTDEKTGEDVVYDLPPSDTAIIFYLKTKGKKRGYIEKTETGFTNNEGRDINPVQIVLPDNGRRYTTKDSATEGLPREGA